MIRAPLAALYLTLLAGCVGPTLPVTYPATPRSEQVDRYHGVSVADPYRALEQLDSPETARWVAAQNTASVPFLESLPRRDELIARFTRLWRFERWSPPQKRGPRYFFLHDDGKADHARLMVTSALNQPARVLIDPNDFSDDHTASLSRWSVSPNGETIAYAISEGGSDWRHWRTRNVLTGLDTVDVVKHTKFTQVSWAADSLGFYYSRYPLGANGKPDDGKQVTVYFHAVGTPQSDDRAIYRITHSKTRNAYGHVTDDGRFLVFNISDGYLANDVHVQRLGTDEPPVPLLNRWDARYHFLGNIGDELLFRTTHQAPRGRVVAISFDRAGPSEWREVVPQATEALEAASLVGGRVIARYVRDAASIVQTYNAATGQFQGELALRGIGSVYGFDGRADSHETFFAFTSFTVPQSVFRLDVSTQKATPWREARVDGQLDRYETEQAFFESKDKTRVPMFLIKPRGMAPDGERPTLLYGYGGFDVSLTPTYRTRWIAWLELGGMVAIANLRGGGEYGEAWHQAGTKLNKQNVFDDFHAAADWLVANHYTRPERLAAIGRSNGGLLVGATLTQKPAHFGAAGPGVGVLDMLRYHTASANARQWSSDYGLSEDPAEFTALSAYSPVHNARPACYPPTLITTADHDDRVVPWHSYKFAAALQHAQRCDNPVLLRVETRAGHGAGKPLWMKIEAAADRWAFMHWALTRKR